MFVPEFFSTFFCSIDPMYFVIFQRIGCEALSEGKIWEEVQWDGSAYKGACHQAWAPSITRPYMLSRIHLSHLSVDFHMNTVANVCPHQHTHWLINRLTNLKKNTPRHPPKLLKVKTNINILVTTFFSQKIFHWVQVRPNQMCVLTHGPWKFQLEEKGCISTGITKVQITKRILYSLPWCMF